MARFLNDDRVQQVSGNAPNAGATTFDISTAAATGYIKFESMHDPLTGVVIATGDVVPYFAAAAGVFECGMGVVDKTAHTLTRTKIISNSAGTQVKVDFSAGSAPTVSCGWGALQAQSSAARNVPGVRLTHVAGDPISSTHTTGYTTIYAEPYNGNVLPLFYDTTGTLPLTAKMTALSLALSTLAATYPNDIFIDMGVTAGGALSLTKVPWTNATTRVALQLIEGNYYKTSDARFLWVGTLFPKTTTTYDMSYNDLGLVSAYNRRPYGLYANNTGSHAYVTPAFQEWNAGTGSVPIHFGVADSLDVLVAMNCKHTGGSGFDTYLAVGVDSLSSGSPQSTAPLGITIDGGFNSISFLAAGNHALTVIEFGNPGCSQDHADVFAIVQW